MKCRLLVFILLCWAMPVSAQMPDWYWAKSSNTVSPTTAGSYSARGIAVDKQGNSYVTGVFNAPTITFGSITLYNAGGASLTDDIYVVKYGTAGNVIWARRAGDAYDDAVWGIGADSLGNCYITGNYTLSTAFGSFVLAPPPTASGSGCGYIVKYNSSGSIVWAKTTGYNSNSGYVAPWTIAVSAGGDCVITGLCYGNDAVFETTALANNNSVWGGDAFIAKYNASGQLLWADRPLGSDGEEGLGVAIDAEGNCYMTGYSESAMLHFGALSLSGSGGRRFFVVKYNAAGTALWASNSGYLSGASSGAYVASDTSGNTYVTGFYGGYSLRLDTIVISNPHIGANTYFLAKYNPAGRIVWLRNVLQSPYPSVRGLAVDVWGNSYVTGAFFDTVAVCDTLRITGQAGIDNFFALKFNDTAHAVWIRNVSSNTIVQPRGMAILPNGTAYITGDFGDGYGAGSASFGPTVFSNLLPAVFTAKLAACNRPPRQPDSLTGPDTLCANMPVSFWVPAVPDANSYQWTLPTGWTGTSTTNRIVVTPNSQAGILKVAAVNDCGTGASRAFTVSGVLPAPAPVIIQTGNVLKVTSSFNAYQWYRNGTAIPGAISSALTLTPGQSGNYYVVVTNNNTCSGLSNTIGYLMEVKAPMGAASFAIHPNPASDKIYIRFNESMSEGVLLLSDILGQNLRVIVVAPGTTEVVMDMEALPSGMYLLTHQNDAGTTRLKVLKQ